MITAIAGSSPSVLTPKTLGTNDFLTLMTAQLSQQDPFAPQDNSQMVAQMAQMAATSATTDMAATLKNISSQLDTQTALLGKLVPAGTPSA